MDTCSNASAPFTSGRPFPYDEYGIELTVTGYAPDGVELPDGPRAKVVAGPWHGTLKTGPGSYEDFSVPLLASPAEQVRVILEQVVPAQPGWLAGRMRVETNFGLQLGSVRPFLLYARACDIATHTYFVDTSEAVGGAFSVGIRVTREP
jgi:hypothetical protein